MESRRILHYEILRLLGRGGMGEVYEARDLTLQRTVALKFIAPELSADLESAKRFEREALSAAALSHPHIATLFALEHDGATVFIAMELMSGESLRDRIARGPLPIPEALALARDVAGALAHAHRRGIVHRDIKPENLMFDTEGAIKVMDFGLARAAQASRLTMTGTTLGTAAYMAPESTRGAIGAPADVFALGVVLHEMLAGSLPFPGENPLALLYMIANEPPRPLRAARPEVSAEIEAVVLRALDKDHAERIDAAALHRELSTLTGVTAPPPESEAPAAEALAPTTALARQQTEEVEVERVPRREEALVRREPRRHRIRSALFAVGLTLLIVFGLRFVPRLRDQLASPADRATKAQALNDQAVQLLKEGAAGPAMLILRRAITIDPHAAQVRLNLAQAQRSQGDRTGAAATFSAIARDSSVSGALRAIAYAGLGDIAMDDGNWTEAAEDLRRSFALDSSERAYSQLGYALVRAARPAEALSFLRRGLATFAGSAPLHKNAAFALLQLDSLRAARAHADRSLALDPAFAPALAVRARIRLRAGDAAGALADREAYRAASHDSAEAVALDAELRAAGALK
jgi:tetratricopeptide (TPR) repeat protein